MEHIQGQLAEVVHSTLFLNLSIHIATKAPLLNCTFKWLCTLDLYIANKFNLFIVPVWL